MKPIYPFILAMICTTSIRSQITDPPNAKKGIYFENRADLLKAPDCNGSEAYLKKKVKAQLASFYKDYPYISVDFTSFKGQNGYTDKTDAHKIIYPYKIEMLVYLKRKITKEGKLLNEYTIWKYDAVYEYATKPGKKCEFKLLPSSQTTLITRKEY